MSIPTEGGSSGSEGGSPEISALIRGSGQSAKPVTMATIAREVGVSQGAISSLLNERDYGIRVSEKTRARVFKVCRDLGYVPNDLRAVVRIYPELGDTCLMVSDRIPGGLANPFLARVTAAVMANTTRQPVSIAVILYDEAREYGFEELPPPLKHGTASKVICVGGVNSSICGVVHGRSLPAILLGHTSQIPGTTSVVPDYPGAARLALELLVRHGHKRVGIVGGPFGSPEPRLLEMNRAIGAVACELGFLVEAQDIFQSDLTFQAGVAAADSMLARHAKPSALICLSEAAAAGVVAQARFRGISIPGQLSVIAIADHAGSLASCIPLTAVVLSAAEIAAVAVKEAERQVFGGIPETASKIVVPVQLIERESCGPAGN